MLNIFLIVLKIIGWSILSIIGLILFLLLIVLFVPLRYKIYGYKTDEKEDNMMILLKITWLLHFLNIRVLYPQDELIRVRISLFKIFPKKEKKNKEKKVKEKKTKEKDNIVKNSDIDEVAQTEINLKDSVIDTKIDEIEAPESEIPPQIDEDEDDDTSLFDKIKIYADVVYKFILNIKDKIEGIFTKVIDIKNNITYYIDILKSDTFKRAFSKVKDQLIRIFKIIKPRKFKGKVSIGFEDPSTTGMIYGIYSTIYPFIGSGLTVLPYFNVETTVLNGNILIKGRIMIFSLLKVGFKIYFNKDIKRLIKMLKKESNNG